MSTFSFKSNSNTDYGVIVSSLGRRQHAEEQIDAYEIPYRDGSLHVHSGKYQSYSRSMTFGIKDKTKRSAIGAWLTGRGKLITSDDPGGYFNASVIGGVKADKLSRKFDELGVEFECDPFFYLTSGDTVKTCTSSPTSITNLGTIPAAPYIKITGSGAVVLTIGSVSTTFTVSTYIECDSLLSLCYKGTVNAGSSMVGEFPMIPVGTTNISWTGTVTKIEITPRWREL